MTFRALFDIVHPADVHFFKRCINALVVKGNKVVVTSRNKDITIDLLGALGIYDICVTTKGKGLVGLFVEFVRRNVTLWKIAKRFQPDIYVSNNSASAPQVAWIMRRPSLVFDDTEIHRINRYFYYPFVTEVHCPDCYRFRMSSKQKLYPGYHALAYLHKNHFNPNLSIVWNSGISLLEKTVLVRFVDHGSLHDLGRPALSDEVKIDIIKRIGNHSRVLISSENPLPSELEQFRLRMPIEDIHHLMYYVHLVIAESATMSSEAVVLGTPAIFIDEKGRGYTDEQEQKYGLCFNFKPNQIDLAVEKAMELISLDNTKTYFKKNREKILRDKTDVSSYQISAIERLISLGRSIV